MRIDEMVKRNSLKKPRVVLCVPTFNEEDNILQLYAGFLEIKKKIQDRVQLQLQFTDNASTDKTWEFISKLVLKDSDVRAYRFARNIGFQESIFFNFVNSEADAVVQLDADLQDPIELVEIFVDEWLHGAKVVSGVRTRRQESLIVNRLRSLGYRVISSLSNSPIAVDVGDFRLLDMEVVKALRNVKTPTPFIRAIISGFGFPEVKIPYTREARVFGKSKFGMLRLIKFGVSGLVNHSTIAVGVFLSTSLLLLTFLISFSVWIMIKLVSGQSLPTGYTSLLMFIGFLSFVTTLGLALNSLYVNKIYRILNGESYVYFEHIKN